MIRKGFVFPVFLCIYHLLFAIVAWQYSLKNPGDAIRYWYPDKNWYSYFNIGPDIIKLINYAFSKVLHLPFWMGFILYSFIGYLAIFELYKFSKNYVFNSESGIKQLTLMAFFMLPNLHFWTSIIGKEAIVFLAITWIIIHHAKGKMFTLKYVFGWLILILIRPHVALFLLLAIGIDYIFRGKINQKKLITLGVGSALCFILYIMTLSILNRNPFDIAYILERNNASLLAFKRAGSYVPMINYNFVERFFALNFRPLFWDAESFFGMVLSIENGLILILFLSGIYYGLKNYKTVKSDRFVRISLLFFIISSLFFIQRYSCLGIFVRTKIMYMPFVLIALIRIISYHHKKNEEDNRMFL